MISPTHFIPAAEETGMICSLGRWVLTHSGGQGSWWRRGAPKMRLNVNISARQVTAGRFPDEAMEVLGTTGFPRMHSAWS